MTYGKNLLVCALCGKVKFVDDDEEFEEINSKVKSYLNRRIAEGKIKRYGVICPACKAEYGNKPK